MFDLPGKVWKPPRHGANESDRALLSPGLSVDGGALHRLSTHFSTTLTSCQRKPLFCYTVLDGFDGDQEEFVLREAEERQENDLPIRTEVDKPTSASCIVIWYPRGALSSKPRSSFSVPAQV